MTQQDQNTRVRFFERFSSNEYHLALEKEPDDGQIDPLTFDTSDGEFAIAFSTEESLTDFTGGGPHATLPGRVLAAIFAPQKIGICLNPETDPTLLDVQDLNWLIDTLARVPRETQTALTTIEPFDDLAADLKNAIFRRVDGAPGLADHAVIARSEGGPVIAVLGANKQSQPALAGTLQEALIFADAPSNWSIAFLTSESEMAKHLLDVGTVIAFPALEVRKEQIRAAPGSDPSNPPKLR